MKQRTLVLAFLALLSPAALQAAPAAHERVASATRSTTVNAHPWTADVEDNICGIANLKRVSKPATVDYEELLAETPQIQELERKDIRPERLQLEWISAAEGAKFAKVMTEVEELRQGVTVEEIQATREALGDG